MSVIEAVAADPVGRAGVVALTDVTAGGAGVACCCVVASAGVAAGVELMASETADVTGGLGAHAATGVARPLVGALG